MAIKVLGKADPRTLERIRKDNLNKQIAREAQEAGIPEWEYRKQVSLGIKSAFDDLRIQKHRADIYARDAQGNFVLPECHQPFFDYTTRVWESKEVKRLRARR